MFIPPTAAFVGFCSRCQFAAAWREENTNIAFTARALHHFVRTRNEWERDGTS